MNPLVEETAMPADSSDRFDTRFRWRRHPQLRNRPVTGTRDMGGASGRTFAARGIVLARSERLDDARAAFGIAARDETIDLTAIPGFWDLSRSAMLVAASAYEDVERFRDAAALEAIVRTTYRPQLVPSMVSTTRARRKAVGGGD